MPEISQKTLGLLRTILDEMRPDELITEYEVRSFWKDALFDAGFPLAAIDVASSYAFRWGQIIPDLYAGKFGATNSHFSRGLPRSACDETIKNLLAFAIHHNQGKTRTTQLVQSLTADGLVVDSSKEADDSLPAELAKIPGKPLLISDLQRRLAGLGVTGVLFIDLDGFKSVNDTMGHPEGDKCLIRIARTISESILGKGKLYRPGGDEFVVLLPNFNADEAASTAGRIRLAIDRENLGGAVKVTASIGVVSSESMEATDADSLFDLADKAMYEAKKTKNRVVVLGN